MTQRIHLGYQIPAGIAVEIPLGHLAVTGQTQMSGKTTTLEALISRSGLRAVAFVTKRAESSFDAGRSIPPYFRSRSDWQFVSDILESKLHEKLKFQRSWIMKVCRGTHSLEEVQRKVQKELGAAKRGLDQSVYTELDAYLDLVVPELHRLPYTDELDLAPGLNVMDLSGYSTSLQMLVISSVLSRVYERENGVVTIIPEAWEFVPQKRGSPVMRAAEELIRKAAAAGNYVWLDSQDLAGVHKDILKHCSVWILGVQREENEVQRTLDNLYGMGKNKPTANDVRALGKGEFYACWGREMHHVYVQPAWMQAIPAMQIALRRLSVTDVSKPAPKPKPKAEQDPVWKEKFEQSEREKTALAQRLETLEAELRTLRASQTTTPPQPTPPAAPQPKSPQSTPSTQSTPSILSTPGSDVLNDTLYRQILDRLTQDLPQHPQILQVLAERPEITVQVKKVTVQLDGNTLRGRLAILLAEDFFDGGANGNTAFNELKKRGVATAKPNVYRELDKLTEMGFLLKSDSGYQAVPGMKVNLVEAA